MPSRDREGKKLFPKAVQKLPQTEIKSGFRTAKGCQWRHSLEYFVSKKCYSLCMKLLFWMNEKEWIEIRDRELQIKSERADRKHLAYIETMHAYPLLNVAAYVTARLYWTPFFRVFFILLQGSNHILKVWIGSYIQRRFLPLRKT